jgi:hypothetical protein
VSSSVSPPVASIMTLAAVNMRWFSSSMALELESVKEMEY